MLGERTTVMHGNQTARLGWICPGVSRQKTHPHHPEILYGTWQHVAILSSNDAKLNTGARNVHTIDNPA